MTASWLPITEQRPVSEPLAAPSPATSNGTGHHGGPPPDPFSIGSKPNRRNASRAVTVHDVMRYKGTAALVALIFSVPAMLIAWRSHVPMYRAKGEVSVAPIIPRLVYPTSDNIMTHYQQFLNSQVTVVMCPDVLKEVLADPEVQATDWYRLPKRNLFGSVDTPKERLLEELEVQPRIGTQIIDVTMASPKPEDSAILVNKVLDAYKRYVDLKADEVDDELTRKLEDKSRTLKAAIQQNTEQAEKLIGKEYVMAPDQRQIQLISIVAQKQMQLEATQSQLSASRQKLETVDARGTSGPAIPMPAARNPNEPRVTAVGALKAPPLVGGGAVNPTYEMDEAWNRFQTAVKKVEILIREARAWGLTDKNPKLVKLLGELEEAQMQRTMRERQIDIGGPSVGMVAMAGMSTIPSDPETLRSHIQLLEEEERTLTRSIDELHSELRKVAQVIRWNEENRVNRDQSLDVESQLGKRAIERSAPGAISIQTHAFAPSAPFNNKKKLMYLAAAVFVGCVAGAVGAYFRALRAASMTDVDDVVAEIQSPFLGYIPRIRDPRNPTQEEAALHSEAVRIIRTSILQRTSSHGGNAVLVTSAGPSAGKTSLAVSLARSLSRCGKKVLLVDTDLRRPAVSERLGLGLSQGLRVALRLSAAEADRTIIRESENLYVLPAGMPVANSDDAEVLASGAFATCLARWKQNFDVVLLDCPPLLPVADARILARMVDGAIMVVREGSCRRHDVMHALSCLASTGGTLLGTVIVGSGESSRYAQSYYKGYQVYAYKGPDPYAGRNAMTAGDRDIRQD